MIRKIVVCLLLAVLLLTGSLVGAQQPKMPRIGYVDAGSPATTGHRAEAFMQGLTELGYVNAQNIVIDYRWAEGKLERLQGFVAELVRTKVDVIVSSATPAIRIAKEQTTTIPVVMGGVTDPVGNGFVASLARPGGNITGLTHLAPDLTGKRLELLKEVVPRLLRVAVLWNPSQPGQPLAYKESQLAAQALKVTLISLEARSREELERVLSDMGKERAEAFFELPDPLIFTNRKLITEFAAKHRLPAMYSFREYVDAGGLMSYGTSFPDLLRRAATYVDKILKGAKPAELPVEQPTKFELLINLRAAKQLGLTIPQSVLYRADKVMR
ncbi:MAG TPA: ABC transporter substrate-binding protein [Candidatus Binatia bacterium]|nr:ABC transporter substrate-binding protein [Candidatus Binatia bacterium]